MTSIVNNLFITYNCIDLHVLWEETIFWSVVGDLKYCILKNRNNYPIHWNKFEINNKIRYLKRKSSIYHNHPLHKIFYNIPCLDNDTIKQERQKKHLSKALTYFIWVILLPAGQGKCGNRCLKLKVVSIGGLDFLVCKDSFHHHG